MPLNPVSLPQAESKANSKSTGIIHNQSTRAVFAGDGLPGARLQAGTANGQQAGRGQIKLSGGPAGIQIAAYGTVAVATVDTDRARCATPRGRARAPPRA
jgi:hypothetical protein